MINRRIDGILTPRGGVVASNVCCAVAVTVVCGKLKRIATRADNK